MSGRSRSQYRRPPRASNLGRLSVAPTPSVAAGDLADDLSKEECRSGVQDRCRQPRAGGGGTTRAGIDARSIRQIQPSRAIQTDSNTECVHLGAVPAPHIPHPSFVCQSGPKPSDCRIAGHIDPCLHYPLVSNVRPAARVHRSVDPPQGRVLTNVRDLVRHQYAKPQFVVLRSLTRRLVSAHSNRYRSSHQHGRMNEAIAPEHSSSESMRFRRWPQHPDRDTVFINRLRPGPRDPYSRVAVQEFNLKRESIRTCKIISVQPGDVFRSTRFQCDVQTSGNSRSTGHDDHANPVEYGRCFKRRKVLFARPIENCGDSPVVVSLVFNALESHVQPSLTRCDRNRKGDPCGHLTPPNDEN